MDNIVKKPGKRALSYYMLYQLKLAADLGTVYMRVVRPVVEYACPVWHIILPANLPLRLR